MLRTNHDSRRSWAARFASLCVVAAIVCTAGCQSGFDPSNDPNISPETALNVGSGNPIPGGQIRLSWFGWDPDGEIVSFDIRTAPDDTMGEWTSVVTTDSVFTVGEDLTDSWGFWVRAVDNEGAVDATPDSAMFVFGE